MDSVSEAIVVRTLLESNYASISESESSDSEFSLSSDDEPRQKKVRIQFYLEDIVRSYSEEEFKSHFRLSRDTAYKVIGLLEESNYLPRYPAGRQNITSEKAFLLSIWYLSNQETFREVSDRFNVTYSSAHRCLRRILKFLLSKKNEIIKWPSGERINTITNAFQSKHGIENVIGAIDGSHVEIMKPSHDQNAYINRKGYHSLLIQGIVDHEKKFIDVFCGEPGSMHDARLLRKSAIFAKISENPDFIGQYFVLADSAYPNLHWIVTPFKDNGRLTRRQTHFNYAHSATRVIVENAFGLLKSRFRRVKKLENINISLCTEIIMASCVLHNICISNEDYFNPEETDTNQPDEVPFINAPDFSQQSTRQQDVFHKLCLHNTR